MAKGSEAIGIKQVVRIEWYDYALDMLLSGENSNDIRKRLDEFIRERTQCGGYGIRGEQTYTKAIAQIMKCWVTPERERIGFRDKVLVYASKNNRDIRIALHWAVTIAAYPFWHRVAGQIGRLLNLQNSVTQNQIRLRCFEIMGERSTVERATRRVIRSFIAWNVLADSETKGCYKKNDPITIYDEELAIIMIEAELYASQEGKGTVDTLLKNPAIFPFKLPLMSGSSIIHYTNGIDLIRYGLDDELLKFKN